MSNIQIQHILTLSIMEYVSFYTMRRGVREQRVAIWAKAQHLGSSACLHQSHLHPGPPSPQPPPLTLVFLTPPQPPHASALPVHNSTSRLHRRNRNPPPGQTAPPLPCPPSLTRWKCSSIVEQLVSDHIQAQLETLHRTHKQSLAKCPQHPRESHTLVREPGKDAFGRVIKSLSDMNAVHFMCPSCSRKIGAGGWTRHLSKCMGIGGRRPNKLPPPSPLFSTLSFLAGY